LQKIPMGERKLSIYVSRRDGEVLVTVEDNGLGIPKDKLDSIFEPFVTTKEQGTGLGLSLAKTIINTHGGRIWAENSERGGAVFHFTLQIAYAEAV
jgi:signal transduction histidine kinase